jgi:Putative peptidoglycan binding domain
MANGAVAAARRLFEAGGHAAIRPVTLEVIFQKCPGTAAALGISGLNYQLTVGSNPPQNGTTGADGKVTVRLVPGTTATLNVMGTDYRLSVCGSLEAPNSTHGIQRRLQILGYYTGRVDGVVGKKTEYAVLNFQADNNPLRVDGLAGPQTQNRLKTVVGA